MCLTFKPEEGGMFFKNLSVLCTEVNVYLKKEVSKFKIACNINNFQSYEIKDFILNKTTLEFVLINQP